MFVAPGISAWINFLCLYLQLCVFVSHLSSDIYWHKCAMESWFGEKCQYLPWRTTRPRFKNTLTNFKYMAVCLIDFVEWNLMLGTEAMPWAFTDQLRQIGHCIKIAWVKIVQDLSSLYWIWREKPHARDLHTLGENVALPWLHRERKQQCGWHE